MHRCTEGKKKSQESVRLCTQPGFVVAMFVVCLHAGCVCSHHRTGVGTILCVCIPYLHICPTDGCACVCMCVCCDPHRSVPGCGSLGGKVTAPIL